MSYVIYLKQPGGRKPVKSIRDVGLGKEGRHLRVMSFRDDVVVIEGRERTPVLKGFEHVVKNEKFEIKAGLDHYVIDNVPLNRNKSPHGR